MFHIIQGFTLHASSDTGYKNQKGLNIPDLEKHRLHNQEAYLTCIYTKSYPSSFLSFNKPCSRGCSDPLINLLDGDPARVYPEIVLQVFEHRSGHPAELLLLFWMPQRDPLLLYQGGDGLPFLAVQTVTCKWAHGLQWETVYCRKHTILTTRPSLQAADMIAEDN
jgi:hypothetical protein